MRGTDFTGPHFLCSAVINIYHPWPESFLGLHCLYSTAKSLHPLWSVQTVQCSSACTVDLNLYFLYGQYGNYRTSVPVQYSYNSTIPIVRTVFKDPKILHSTAKSLLRLWAVLPLKGLNACRVQLNKLSAYGPYEIYRTPVPVEYIYTTTHTLSRTACTELQCLYRTSILLIPYRPYGP